MQWLEFKFKGPVCPKRVSITFQGGFAARKCAASLYKDSKSLDAFLQLKPMFPIDSNEAQSFALLTEQDEFASGQKLRLAFSESADFYGRVVVYEVHIWGTGARSADV